MELSVESPCQHVTWKIQDFFELPSEIGYFLDSPEFRFADETYCLRLYPNGALRYLDEVRTVFHIVRLTSTAPERNISCKFGFLHRYKGCELELYKRPGRLFKKLRYSFSRSEIERNRDWFTSDGAFTVVCYMRLGEQSSPGSSQCREPKTSEAEEEQVVLPGQYVIFSSRWRSSKMELSIESPCQYVTWKIRDYLQLPLEIGYSLQSPEFLFAGDRYCLRFYPNGDTTDTHLQLVRLTSTVSKTNISYKFGYKGKEGEREETEAYDCSGTSFKDFDLLNRSYIEERRNLYIENGTFTLLCSMRLEEQSNTGSPKSEEAAEEQEVLLDMSKLLSDYKHLLEKGAESDMCLMVSGKEFRAHKNILRARSPVFDAMFDHETIEKETGRVIIDDLDQESFGDFLEYLYTGQVGNGFSDNNAFGLYTAADKYDVPTLKSVCVAYMRRTLSVDSFCDVITLALRHHEEELLHQAVRFFKDNMARIIVTMKWQQFLIDNGTAANELLIKAIVPREQ